MNNLTRSDRQEEYKYEAHVLHDHRKGETPASLYIHAVYECVRRHASVLWRPYDVLENPELLLYGHDL